MGFPVQQYILLLVFLGFIPFTLATRVKREALTDGTHNSSTCHPETHEGIHLVSFRWEELGVYFTISAFVIIAGFAKLGFHKLKWLSSKVPESCLLILLGLALSALIYFTTKDKPINPDPCHTEFKFPQFTSETFFIILLPPIILESAYSLYDRVFLDNLGTVLIFAVIGTLFNVFAIGASLFGVKAAGLIPSMSMSLTEAFVFSSLISAVDPVAVLAIFQELGVNQNLYFLIFGESLLNDGVTVVLYNTMVAFRRMSVVAVGQYFLAILSFFIVCFGGILIGIIYGLLTALVTKWTNTVRVVEPLAMLGLAYLSYLTAEMFHFSGIICLIVCGLIQAHFGFYNISHKSYICVKYFTKMASATSDTIIFMFLGLVLVNDEHEWNTEFVLWSLLFCFVYRFIAVFVLSALANLYRGKAIDYEEQFIAAYGGLRGAVAFSLATSLDQDIKERNTYIFTTLIIILFTIFIQGITIKPLVHLLNIQRRNRQNKNLVEEISESTFDHMMAGIEEILGHHGDFYLREMLRHYNEKYLKKWFLHETCNSKLTRLFEKIALSEHYAHLYGPVAMVEDHFKPLINYPSKDDVRMSPVSPMIQKEEMLYRASPVRRRSTSKSLFIPRAVAPAPGSGSTVHEGHHDTDVLRRALRDNKYNKLHYTYNRNLVDEEDQEMTNHLSRRSLNAQRMTTLASASVRKEDISPDDGHADLPGQVPEGRDKSVTFEPLSSSILLRKRHERRSFLQRERVKSLETDTPPVIEETDGSNLSGALSIDLRGVKNADNTGEIAKENDIEEIPLLKMPEKSRKDNSTEEV